jgi:hypothetical protein
VNRLGLGAFTYELFDQAGSASIVILPANQRWFAKTRFNGTNWQPHEAAQMP